MTPKGLVQLLAVVCALSLFGCQKASTSTDSGAPASGANANSASAGNASGTDATAPPTANSGGSSAVSELKAALAPKPIVVQSGTEIVVTADESVSSKTNTAGDTCDASLAEPVVVGDKVVIPKGAKANGTVVSAKSAGKFKGNAELIVALDSVTVKGKK